MSYDCKSPEDVVKTIKDNKIEMVDLRFADLPGLWQHFSVPPRALSLDSFAEGVGFDGSSIRGFQEIQESDMMVVPDPTTAFLDPFTEAPTLALICNIRDPITGESYSRDVRHVAKRPRPISRRRRLATPPTSAPSLSTLSSMKCVTTKAPTMAITKSTPWRQTGKRRTGMARALLTSFAPKRVIFRCRLPMPSRMRARRAAGAPAGRQNRI
jgi:hypothetical protein